MAGETSLARYSNSSTNYSSAQYANWPRFRLTLNIETRMDPFALSRSPNTVTKQDDGQYECVSLGDRLPRKPYMKGGRR